MWAIQLHQVRKRGSCIEVVAVILQSVWGRTRHSRNTLRSEGLSSLSALWLVLVIRYDLHAAICTLSSNVSRVSVAFLKFDIQKVIYSLGPHSLLPFAYALFDIWGIFMQNNTFLLALSVPVLCLLYLWESKETFPFNVQWAELDSHPYLHLCKLRSTMVAAIVRLCV